MFHSGHMIIKNGDECGDEIDEYGEECGEYGEKYDKNEDQYGDEHTTEPWITKLFWMLAEREAVTIAVNIAIILIPITIHIIQNKRPRMDLGARSPYLE